MNWLVFLGLLSLSCVKPVILSNVPNAAKISSSDCHIKEIDGNPISDFFRRSYQVSPGDHAILVVLDQDSKRSTKPKKRIVEIQALPGHSYRIYKDEVIDLTSKKSRLKEDFENDLEEEDAKEL